MTIFPCGYYNEDNGLWWNRKFWINFQNENNSDNRLGLVAMSELLEERYGCRMEDIDGVRSFVFENNEDATYFMLKYA